MCRKCGEPDRRGSAATRRARTAALLELHGNGVVCPCTWCGTLLGRTAGYLAVAGRRLPIMPLERDRLMPGGSYALWNLVPSCGPCNRARTYADPRFTFDEAGRCYFGTVNAAAVAAAA